MVSKVAHEDPLQSEKLALLLEVQDHAGIRPDVQLNLVFKIHPEARRILNCEPGVIPNFLLSALERHRRPLLVRERPLGSSRRIDHRRRAGSPRPGLRRPR